MNKTAIDLEQAVIGIPLTACFMCGAPGTRHHVIPQAMKPIRNATIPLCEAHKGITHTIIKTIFVPKQARQRLIEAMTKLNLLKGDLNAIKSSFKLHRHNKTATHIPSPRD